MKRMNLKALLLASGVFAFCSDISQSMNFSGKDQSNSNYNYNKIRFAFSRSTSEEMSFLNGNLVDNDDDYIRSLKEKVDKKSVSPRDLNYAFLYMTQKIRDDSLSRSFQSVFEDFIRDLQNKDFNRELYFLFGLNMIKTTKALEEKVLKGNQSLTDSEKIFFGDAHYLGILSSWIYNASFFNNIILNLIYDHMNTIYENKKEELTDLDRSVINNIKAHIRGNVKNNRETHHSIPFFIKEALYGMVYKDTPLSAIEEEIIKPGGILSTFLQSSIENHHQLPFDFDTEEMIFREAIKMLTPARYKEIMRGNIVNINSNTVTRYNTYIFDPFLRYSIKHDCLSPIMQNLLRDISGYILNKGEELTETENSIISRFYSLIDTKINNKSLTQEEERHFFSMMKCIYSEDIEENVISTYEIFLNLIQLKIEKNSWTREYKNMLFNVIFSASDNYDSYIEGIISSYVTKVLYPNLQNDDPRIQLKISYLKKARELMQPFQKKQQKVN